MQTQITNESPVLLVGLSNLLFLIIESHLTTLSMQKLSIIIAIIVGLYGFLKQVEKSGGFRAYFKDWINFSNLFKSKK